MTLQAQKVDLAHSQEARIRGAMRRVATGAAFCLDRYMFIHKRTTCIGVALNAYSISAGHGLGLAESGGAVNVVAVTALNESLIYAMMVRPGKVSLGSGMARIALRGLFLDEQMLRLLRVMRRVAVKAAHSIAGVG